MVTIVKQLTVLISVDTTVCSTVALIVLKHHETCLYLLESTPVTGVVTVSEVEVVILNSLSNSVLKADN